MVISADCFVGALFFFVGSVFSLGASGCRGRRLLAPLDLDMGFVGYPCVDLSSLNIGQSKFMDANTATGKGEANVTCCLSHSWKAADVM